jgi:DNA-binding response OmpR family regulator
MKKIMIVDDEVDTRAALSDFLSSEGYSVLLAPDGKKCLESISRFKPDLILLDLMMPTLSGVEVLQKIKGIKVIIISVMDKTAIFREYPEVLEYPYYQKPFKKEALLTEIKRSLK